MNERYMEKRTGCDITMKKNLTTEEYWEEVWNDIRLPIITKPSYDVHKILTQILPCSKKLKFIEIGCAPGGWMAYFNKTYNYAVSGIEYAKNAANATKQNLKIQGILADIKTLDFFDYKTKDPAYDVVFSCGFVEHFKNLHDVIRRLSNLSRQYVITNVPNVYGINGFISKTIRPKVYNAHKKIDLDLLRSLHEEQGFETIFCDYIGGIRIILPADKRAFFKKHAKISKLINRPIEIFNFISNKFSKNTGIIPRTKLFSTSLMYVGKRRI